jgi:uncharacterized protein
MYYTLVIEFSTLRLKALLSLLETAQIQAQEKGMNDADILGLRIAADMFPFAKQIQIATDNAKGMASRLARKENPVYADTETTLDELKSRITKTIDYLATFTPEDFKDADTAEARFPYFPGLHMVGEWYLLIVTTYSILRHHGFAVWKVDYMGKDVALLPDAQA